MSVIMQGLLAVAITVVLVVVGVYVPLSPVAQERDEVDKAVRQRSQLNQEVTQLQVYRQRYGELKSQMDALSKQLETLKTIVPEEKEVDEFIRLVQGAASASNVQIRRLTAKPVVAREYHYDMPFEVQADGPYFNMLGLFRAPQPLVANYQRRRSGLRGCHWSEGRENIRFGPGTSVSGIFTATTFFTKPADTGAAPAAAGAKPQPAGKL